MMLTESPLISLTWWQVMMSTYFLFIFYRHHEPLPDPHSYIEWFIKWTYHPTPKLRSPPKLGSLPASLHVRYLIRDIIPNGSLSL